MIYGYDKLKWTTPKLFMGTVPPLNHVVLVGSVVDSDKLLLMSAEGLQRLRYVDAIAVNWNSIMAAAVLEMPAAPIEVRIDRQTK